VLRLPLPELPRAMAALVLGGLVALPFLWSDVKSMIRL